MTRKFYSALLIAVVAGLVFAAFIARGIVTADPAAHATPEKTFVAASPAKTKVLANVRFTNPPTQVSASPADNQWARQPAIELVYHPAIPERQQVNRVENARSTNGPIRGKPKLSAFSGLGCDHYARADV